VPEWFFQLAVVPVAEKSGFAGTGISRDAHIVQNRLRNQRQSVEKTKNAVFHHPKTLMTFSAHCLFIELLSQAVYIPSGGLVADSAYSYIHACAVRSKNWRLPNSCIGTVKSGRCRNFLVAAILAGAGNQTGFRHIPS
jgi:hypothetical protein